MEKYNLTSKSAVIEALRDGAKVFVDVHSSIVGTYTDTVYWRTINTKNGDKTKLVHSENEESAGWTCVRDRDFDIPQGNTWAVPMNFYAVI